MTLAAHFSEVRDPRLEHLVEHRLTDVIMIAICATLCGAEGWEEMSDWAREKKEWLGERCQIDHS